MTPRWPRRPLARAMLVVLAACVVLDGISFGRALHRDAGGTGDGAPALSPVAVPRLPAIYFDSGAEAIDTLADDPFDADRGGVVAQAGTPAPADAVVAPDAVVALVGTVIRADGGSLAVCRLGSQPPRILHVGDRIGALTLLEVEQGRATFRDGGGARVSLRLAAPGA